MAVLDVVRRGARDLAWFWRGIVGEDAYDKYCAHVRAQQEAGDPTHPLLSARDFWRDRTDRQESNPQGRCC